MMDDIISTFGAALVWIALIFFAFGAFCVGLVWLAVYLIGLL